MSENRSGFSLVGPMIVMVIFIILAVIAVSALCIMQRADKKETDVKGICYTVQLAAEDYAVRYDGYGDSVNDLLPLLPGDGVLLRNSFTDRQTEPRDKIMATELPGPGQVFYYSTRRAIPVLFI